MFTKFKNAAQNLTSRSLQRKMLLIFTVMLVIPVVLVSYFSYNSSSRQLELKMQESMHTSVDLLAAGINESVTAAKQNVSQLSQQLTSADLDNKNASTRTLIELFIKEHPELELFVGGNENGAWMKAPDPGPQDYDPRTRDWYSAALGNPGEVTLTDPTVSLTTGNYTLFISETLKDGNGAIATTFNLKALSDRISSNKLGKEGYYYVVDRNNKFVSHPVKKPGRILPLMSLSC